MFIEKIKKTIKKYLFNKMESGEYTQRTYKDFPLKKIDIWDKKVLKRVYFKFEEKEQIRKTAKIISLLGDPRLWIGVLIILGIYGIIIGDYSQLIVFSSGFVQSYIIYYLIKNYIKRPRPFVEFEGEIKNLDKTGHGYSFPSGHSHHSTILMGLTLLSIFSNPGLIITILVIYNIAIPISRLISGVHYPSDVIFAVIEGYIAVALHWFVTKYIYLFIFNSILSQIQSIF